MSLGADQSRADQGELTRRAVAKAGRRLVWVLVLMYVINYLDRVNVGFAALTMNRDLGLSNAAYGLGAGLFFIGYFLFEVPSNLILHKVGARLWMARIMISWGILASAMAFIQGPGTFYLVRFLLGFAEAGFFPGIVLYLTYWFPRANRAKVMSLFMLGVPLASVFGAPVSTWLIQNGSGVLGFEQGWRTMYFIEGLPAIVLGCLVFALLPSRPDKARWLSEDEARALSATIAAEDAARVPHQPTVWRAMRHPKVVALSAVYFGVVFGLYGLGFFLPKIISGMQQQYGVKFSLVQVGLITAIPYAVGAVVMLLNARHSDRSGDRVWHTAVPAFVGAAGVATALYMNSPVLAIAALTVCTAGVLAAIPVVWQLPTAFLGGFGAAAGIALINSFGNLSGFLGPYLTGKLSDLTGSFQAGMWVIAGFMAAAGVIVLSLRREAASEAASDVGPDQGG
ncbi:MFS transporter [Pseudonocardia eucalypti]|uniref:MFS transporter n=1 Tax=Pseudonocardia eucalypti TaxID=648755 RepID=A0ABP9RA88_9PSEU|nr:MFS family permease [Pseudonocardia eucalypti]